ncbi:MAG: type II toxin-antitoxin system RelE/ParE family toxin [Flavobacteriales bacterium]|nr:type II toxin-antitoxin system RelE/ParE family toxin [Flavobacteriales bacterium]
MNGSESDLDRKCANERLQILTYWAERNGSFRYSEKLDSMFRTALRLIAVHPKLGRSTSDPDVRVKEVGEHKIFYKTTASEVHVLSV